MAGFLLPAQLLSTRYRYLVPGWLADTFSRAGATLPVRPATSPPVTLRPAVSFDFRPRLLIALPHIPATSKSMQQLKPEEHHSSPEPNPHR